MNISINTKLIRLLLFLVSCLWLYSCAVGLNGVSNKYNDKDFIISAIGSGENLDAAKEKALANLSQSIYVSINSTMQSSEQLVNNQFDTKANYDIISKSQGYFQGVVFYNGFKEKAGYIVSAGISKEAYISTVSYLYNLVDEDKISALSKTQAQEELPQLMFLLSMLYYGKANDILIPNVIVEQRVIQAINYVSYIVNSAAEVKFVNNRKDQDEVKINFNGRIYLPNTRIFTDVGVYNYVISSPRFKEKNGSIVLRKGDKPTIAIYLQKLLAQPLKVKAIINNNSNLSNDDLIYLLNEVINNNQMEVDRTSANKLILRVGEVKVYPTFNSYNAVQTNVELLLYKGDILNKQSSFTVTYLTQDQPTTIPFNVFKLQFYNNLEIFLATLFD